MTDQTLTPVVYRECGCSINVPSPSVHDPDGKLAAVYAATGRPVPVGWNGGKCWNHDSTGYTTAQDASVWAHLRKAGGKTDDPVWTTDEKPAG